MTTQALRRLPSSTLHASLASACCLVLVACADPVEEQLPLRAALDYVYHHPEYVLADPDAELLDSELPEGDDAELDRRLAGDWVARTLADHDHDHADDDPLAWPRQAVTITRDTLLSQRDPELYLDADDCACQEHFDDAAFARLVRGFSNCDGFNHVTAMLLFTHEPDAHLRELDDPDHDTGHTLAAIPGDDGLIFVDAWADFGLMVLSRDVAPGVAIYAELPLDDAPDHGGIYPRRAYAHSHKLRNVELFYGWREPDGPDLTIPAELPPIRDARDAYLRARVFDLYGLKAEALPLYQQAADMSCDDRNAPICRLASAFTPRSQLSSRERGP